MSDLRTRIRSTLDDALDEGWNEDAWTDAVLAVFAAWLRERAERADKGVELAREAMAESPFDPMIPIQGAAVQGAAGALRKAADEIERRDASDGE